MNYKINSLFFTNFGLLFILNSILVYSNNTSIILYLSILALLLINLGFFFFSVYKTFKKKNANDIFNFYKKITLFTFIFFFISILLVAPFLFAFILVIFISILGHEAGHAFFMRLFGVRLVDFSIGFGEPIFSKKIGNLTLNLRNILLGGYVKPIDDVITRELEKVKNDKNYLKEVEKKYNIKENELYLSKKLWQKILILTGGVLFNLLFAITSIFILIKLSNSDIKKITLSKAQKEFLIKEQEKNKVDKNIYNYMLRKMPPTIWLHTRRPSNNTIKDTIYETKNAILLTFYSIKYALDHPYAFLHFKSFVGIGKDIYKLENHNLMNWKIFFAIVALINISLFLINILPLPALDGGQIVKELIAHATKQIKNNDIFYYKIIYSKFVIFAEYTVFTIIFIYMVILVIKDIFI